MDICEQNEQVLKRKKPKEEKKKKFHSFYYLKTREGSLVPNGKGFFFWVSVSYQSSFLPAAASNQVFAIFSKSLSACLSVSFSASLLLLGLSMVCVAVRLPSFFLQSTTSPEENYYFIFIVFGMGKYQNGLGSTLT